MQSRETKTRLEAPVKGIECAIGKSRDLIQLEKQQIDVLENANAINTTFGLSAFSTKRVFLKNGACSKALINIIDSDFDHQFDLEVSASTSSAGGLTQGYPCPMLWKTALAAGVRANRSR